MTGGAAQGSLHEIGLVDDASRLPAGHADEDALVQPVEGGSGRLDLRRGSAVELRPVVGAVQAEDPGLAGGARPPPDPDQAPSSASRAAAVASASSRSWTCGAGIPPGTFTSNSTRYSTTFSLLLPLASSEQDRRPP